jgi:FkbM family methyltransferase
MPVPLAERAKDALRFLTRNLRMRIRRGPCQGLLWSLPTRIKFLRGDYEGRLAEFVAAALRKDDVFWDVGAHFGYYSLLASRAAADGQCHAFEPSERNLWYLRHHVQWNRLENVTVHPFALCAHDGTADFGSGRGTGSGRVKLEGMPHGGCPVLVRSIDSLVVGQQCAAPTFLKIDVQGAEAEVLRGGKATLAGRVGVVCVATHNRHVAGVHDQCRAILVDLGYEVRSFPRQQYLVATSPNRPIPSLPFNSQ